MLDSLYCSELGLPSVAVISAPFQTLARHTCRNKGQPDFGILVVEHPVWTRDDSWIEATADTLIQPLLRIMRL